MLSRLRHFSNVETCRTFFHAHSMSRINYVSNVWNSRSDVSIKKLISVHKRAVKVLHAFSQMLPGRGHTSVDPLPLKQHLQCNKCILMHKVVHNKSPACLRQLLRAGTRSDVNSRNNIFVLPKTRIDLYTISFSYSGSYRWNMLPSDFKNTCSVDTLKYKILQHFRSNCDMRQLDMLNIAHHYTPV